MTYSVENVNGCTKKIMFEFDQIDLSDQIKQALVEKQKTSNLKGFRKGKAPLAMIEKLYRPQVEADALNRFVQTKFFEAVDKEEIRVVGYPTFENMEYEGGDSVKFDAMVEVFPEVELKDFSKLSFTKDKLEVTDKEVEDLEKRYLESKAEMKEVEDKGATLKEGQFAVINFEGEKEDGTRPDNMKAEEFLLEIGSGQFIPGFEEKITGMKAEDKKTIEVTFPEDYHAEDLKGAKVKFDVELLEIKEKNFPEFTDELAKEFGFESVEDMKTKNRNQLEEQKERQAKEKLHQEILEKMVEEVSFDVPRAMIDQQKKHLREDLERTLKQQGFTDEMAEEYFEKWNEDVEKKANFQVRSGLILDSLAKKHEIEVSDSDIEEKLKEMASGSGLEMDKLKEYYLGNDQMKQNLKYSLREEKTFEVIIDKEVKVS